MNKYSDIKIGNDDIMIIDNQAVIIKDRDVIIQDAIIAIRESGLATELIAERAREFRMLIFLKIQLLIEEDSRIIPGTVKIKELQKGLNRNCAKWLLSASTYDFGKIDLEISA